MQVITKTQGELAAQYGVAYSVYNNHQNDGKNRVKEFGLIKEAQDLLKEITRKKTLSSTVECIIYDALAFPKHEGLLSAFRNPINEKLDKILDIYVETILLNRATVFENLKYPNIQAVENRMNESGIDGHHDWTANTYSTLEEALDIAEQRSQNIYESMINRLERELREYNFVSNRKIKAAIKAVREKLETAMAEADYIDADIVQELNKESDFHIPDADLEIGDTIYLTYSFNNAAHMIKLKVSDLGQMRDLTSFTKDKIPDKTHGVIIECTHDNDVHDSRASLEIVATQDGWRTHRSNIGDQTPCYLHKTQKEAIQSVEELSGHSAGTLNGVRSNYLQMSFAENSTAPSDGDITNLPAIIPGGATGAALAGGQSAQRNGGITAYVSMPRA